MAKVMVFAPHPDDDIVGCGGSIVKHLQKGDDVQIVYMTSGDAGSLDYTKEELSTIREEESKEALKKLGINNPIEVTTYLRNPDGYLECNKENLVKVINLIRKLQPYIVYVPHATDGHKDHMTTYEIVSQSVERASGPWFQETEGKPWEVSKVIAYEFWTPLQDYNYVVDISDVIDVKLEAIKEHKSQVKDIAYPDLIDGINKYRGASTGKGKYCECFQILKFNDLL